MATSKAMLGSTEVGAEEIFSLARDVGVAECHRYIEGILSYAERRMRSALSGYLPDGTFYGEEMTDNDWLLRRRKSGSASR